MDTEPSTRAFLPGRRVPSARLIAGEPRLPEIRAQPNVLLRMKGAGATAQEVRTSCGLPSLRASPCPAKACRRRRCGNCVSGLASGFGWGLPSADQEERRWLSVSW